MTASDRASESLAIDEDLERLLLEHDDYDLQVQHVMDSMALDQDEAEVAVSKFRSRRRTEQANAAVDTARAAQDANAAGRAAAEEEVVVFAVIKDADDAEAEAAAFPSDPFRAAAATAARRASKSCFNRRSKLNSSRPSSRRTAPPALSRCRSTFSRPEASETRPPSKNFSKQPRPPAASS